MAVRYGFNDLVVEGEITPQKYVQVFDEESNLLGEVECYFVEDEDEEE